MIITKTPLRLSLLGGNTDFPAYFKKYGGSVLTTTIDKYIYCIVKERFDKEIRINYSVKEIVTDIKDIKHDLAREALNLMGVTEGIEITFLSDIPSEGSGLGSSSAVVVGLLNALHEYKNEPVTQRQLTNEACQIEIDRLKKPIGVQDQLAVAYGGSKKFKFGLGEFQYVCLDDHFQSTFKDSLMLFYTGKTRSADKILSKMKLNKEILDKNKRLVNKGMEALINYDLYRFGDLLNEYWNLKKKLNNKVSDDSIDKIYQRALDLGALGGKIVGAGGGGFLLLVVPEYRKRFLRKSLGLKELPFKFSKYGSRVVFNDE